MKFLRSALFGLLAVCPGGAYASGVQPSGLYNGASAGETYWRGGAVRVKDFAYAMSFTNGANGLQGDFHYVGREGLVGAVVNGGGTFETEQSYSFPALGTTVKWYPTLCGGELTMQNISVSKLTEASITTTYAFTVSDDGQYLTLTYLSGVYSSGVSDYYVKGYKIQLEQP